MAQRSGGRGGGERRRIEIDRRINRSLGNFIGTMKGARVAMLAVIAMLWNRELEEKPRYGSKYRIRTNTWLKADKKARKRAYASRRFNRHQMQMRRHRQQSRRLAHDRA